MKASAAAVAERGPAGRTRLTRLRSHSPLVLRATGSTLTMVGGAGGPLGGDELTLSVDVLPGARLCVRSAAASVVQPGTQPAAARLTVRVTVGDGAELDWRPEPTVVVAGAELRSDVRVTLAPDARLYWRDVTVLGRHGAPPGRAIARLRVTRGGRALLDQEHAWGPGAPGGWDGPAVLGQARVVATALTVGAPMPEAAQRAAVNGTSGSASWLIAVDAVLSVAVGPDSLGVLTRLEP
jgi:urease accessory protein